MLRASGRQYQEFPRRFNSDTRSPNRRPYTARNKLALLHNAPCRAHYYVRGVVPTQKLTKREV